LKTIWCKNIAGGSDLETRLKLLNFSFSKILSGSLWISEGTPRIKCITQSKLQIIDNRHRLKIMLKKYDVCFLALRKRYRIASHWRLHLIIKSLIRFFILLFLVQYRTNVKVGMRPHMPAIIPIFINEWI
jgi:hypothetical protein